MTTDESVRNSQTLAQIEAAYSQWGDSLLRFASRLCGNRDDAEDIVVETFAHAYRKWDTFRGTGTRLSWLYGIAVNRHRMSRRKQRLNTESISDDMPAAATNMLDRIVVEQTITRLPLVQREAFLLVKSEGLTSKEAAEILGRPLGTILYEIFQAVRSIRRELLGRESDPQVVSRLCEVEP
jgi:RNA polymerase sigma-70 factor, ECF subfamily